MGRRRTGRRWRPRNGCKRPSTLCGRCRKKGWTQTRLARAAGCDQTSISKLFLGKITPGETLLKKLLAALDEPLDALDRLPTLGFEPGSAGFRLKGSLLRALLAGGLPTEEGVCARQFLEANCSDPAYRETPRSPNLDDAVWGELVADRYFTIDDAGRYRPASLSYDVKGNFLLYLGAMVSSMSRVRTMPSERRPHLIATVDDAMHAWEQSLDQPEPLASAIDACSYALAAGDRMLLSALVGHAGSLRFFLEVGSSVVGGQAEHHQTIVRPFFAATIETLRAAWNDLLQDNGAPIRDVMAQLGGQIDAIYADWAAQGMLDAVRRRSAE